MEWVLNLWPEDRQDKKMIAVSLLLVVISGYFLFFYRAEFGVRDGAVFLGLLNSDKPVRIRHARTLQWGSDEKRIRIYLKDTVFTPENTVAEFQWKNQKIILEPESLVQFDQDSSETLEITLIEGTVKLDDAAAKLVKLIKVQKPSIAFFNSRASLYLPEINSFFVRQSELFSRASDILNKKRVKKETLAPVMVPKLSLNQLSDYRLVLKSPESKTHLLNQGAWIPFEWVPLPFKDVEYEIQIDVSENFNYPFGIKTRQPQWEIMFESQRSYWWRVVATRRLQSLFSEGRSFSLVINPGTANPNRSFTSIGKIVGNELTPFDIIFRRASKVKGNELTPFDIMFRRASKANRR